MNSSLIEWLCIGGGFTTLGTALSWFIFLPYKKQGEALKNEMSAINIWKDALQDAREDNKCKDNKIDELYKEIKQYRDENSALYKEIEELAIKNARSESIKCDVRNCQLRNPPSAY